MRCSPCPAQVGNARLSDVEARTHFAAWYALHVSFSRLPAVGWHLTATWFRMHAIVRPWWSTDKRRWCNYTLEETDSAVALPLLCARRCITSAPLILGHDLTDAASAARAWPIVTNARAIAVNQARYNSSAGRVLQASSAVFNASAEVGARGAHAHVVSLPREQVWCKPLSATETAVLAINLWNVTAHAGIAIDLTVLYGVTGTARVTDVWTGASVVVDAAAFRTKLLPPHSSQFFVVSHA